MRCSRSVIPTRFDYEFVLPRLDVDPSARLVVVDTTATTTIPSSTIQIHPILHHYFEQPHHRHLDQHHHHHRPLTMWMSCESDCSQQRDQIFRELNQEIEQASTNTRLSAALRHKLERLSLQERSQLVNQAGDRWTPLFAAARNGVVEIVRYLLETCGANLEVPFNYQSQYVTPLWCAAVDGKIEVCRVLVKHGADVNTMSKTGLTAVRAACYMKNIDVVKFLVGQGADVNLPDHDSIICLRSSVWSTELCAFLLEQGADINARDSKFKTALHHAVQEDQLETTKLLLKHGADHLARNMCGDDVLQTACLMGRAAIAEYLIETMNYPPERVADALELLGASYVEKRQGNTMALEYWRRAVTYRELHKIDKKITEPPKDVFLNRVPFCTLDDVNALAHHTDEMWLQSLIVNERVLGPSHEHSTSQLMRRGKTYAANMQHQRCIDLWKYSVEIRLSKDTVLHRRTYDDLRSLIKITFDAHAKHTQGLLDAPVRLSDVMFLLEKLIDCLPAAMQQLEQRPVFFELQDNWNGLLENVINLLYLAEILPKSAENTLQLERMTRKLVVVNPVTTNGNTLLHSAVGWFRAVNLRRLYGYQHWVQDPIHSDPVTTRLLLRCGAQVEAVNKKYSTPLHIASLRVNYREEIVRMLLDAGAHIDRTDKQGNQPYRMLGDNPECRIKVPQLLTLKCLAASKVKSHQRNYEGLIPHSIEDFIRMH